MSWPPPGSRVRLCKGAYAEPESVAFQSALDVDKSYVRCLNILMSGDGLPDGGDARPAADRDRRGPGPLVRPRRRTSTSSRCSTASARRSRPGWPATGHTVRVYVPYGDQWYGYLMRRLAERPANVAFFGRALTSRK